MPTNSNLPIAHAAATPKTRFAGTAIAAASSVSRIAESVSGSVKLSKIRGDALAEGDGEDAGQRRKQKDAKKDHGDADQQAARRAPTPVTAVRGAGGQRANHRRQYRAARRLRGVGSFAAAAPALQRVDAEEHDERDDQHHDRDRRRARVVVLFELRDDRAAA